MECHDVIVPVGIVHTALGKLCERFEILGGRYKGELAEVPELREPHRRKMGLVVSGEQRPVLDGVAPLGEPGAPPFVSFSGTGWNCGK